MLEAVLKLLQAGGWVSIIGNKANSVQLQLPTGTELGNKLINLLSTPVLTTSSSILLL